jgi:Lrp/AsnC family transcriptional regulator, regulator for asnA, asnC and gidA
MAINSAVKLDSLDMKILYELDCDASQPFARIGKKLHAGRDIIAYRVKRLEEAHVIEKYTPIIDFGKAGYIAAALYLKFHHDTPEIRKQILDYYSSLNEIWWCFDMSPDYDIAIGWFGKDLPDLRRIQKRLLGKFRKYFRTFKVRTFVHFIHFTRNYLSPQSKPSPPIVVDSVSRKITDEVDDKILHSLSENARKPYVEIAKELKLSPAQVHYRISELKKNKVILFSRVKLDLEKIGFEYFKLDIYLDDFSAMEKISKYAYSLPSTIYAFDVIGGADIELDIHTRDFLEFMEIVDGIKSKFHPFISHVEYYQFKKEYKQAYFPQEG